MLVLIHGAGHTADIWDTTKQFLERPTLSVDLPGRAGKGGALAELDVVSASRSLAEDISTSTQGDVILVGHSAAGTLLPSVASQLGGRVLHLVFVAGVSAPEGQLPAEMFAPGRSRHLGAHLGKLRERHAGLSFEELDARAARDIDSLTFSCEPMRWAGVPASLPRTFIRCLRDPIQPRDVQARLIESCGAGHVIDIDAGHTPALDSPEELARILTEIFDRHGALVNEETWSDR